MARVDEVVSSYNDSCDFKRDTCRIDQFQTFWILLCCDRIHCRCLHNTITQQEGGTMKEEQQEAKEEWESGDNVVHFIQLAVKLFKALLLCFFSTIISMFISM